MSYEKSKMFTSLVTIAETKLQCDVPFPHINIAHKKTRPY